MGTTRSSEAPLDAGLVILDVDGTLVDSNYQHVLAWEQAFREHGLQVPAWRIHRHVGMGGDQLVKALVGEEADADYGDAIRDTRERLFTELYLPVIRAFDDAVPFLRRLRGEGRRVVLASSSKQHELDRYLELLDADALTHAATSASDVDHTKPDPDLLEVAIERGGGGRAVMVGDSVWDCVAAERIGLPLVGVLTGGFGEAELLSAGAIHVWPSLGEFPAPAPLS